MLNALLALVSWYVYRRLSQGDPRRMRIAVAFVATIWFAALVVFEVASYIGTRGLFVNAVLLLAPFSVVVLAVILLRNGLQMLRKEGRSLGNSLSGLLGIALLALPVLGLWIPFALGTPGIGISLILLYGSAQVGISFLVFWTFWKLYMRRLLREDPDAVVVLGSGLIGGEVPPLLRSRLDRGRACYETVRGSGRQCMVIPSGGQGPDEPRSESAAMGEYLIGQGLDESDLVLEDHSRTTEQNLTYSRRAADEELARRDVEPSEHLLVVTNGYHVARAALLSRRVGVDADVTGARTARYFVPSAFLREFAAVMLMHRWWQVALAVPGLLAGGTFIVSALVSA